MSLESVNTFGTLLTAAIIAATAIAAMVQLRHLRAGNQINAMLSIGAQFDDKAFREAEIIVREKVTSALNDPLYREYELAIARNQPAPAVPEGYVELRNATRLICNTYEELGILMKNGVVDKNLFLDRFCWVVNQQWRRLEERTAYIRSAAGNDALLENFEYLTVLSQDYMRQHSSAYPEGVRRLQLHNPWPVPPLSATA